MNKESNIQDSGQEKEQNGTKPPSPDLNNNNIIFVPAENIQAIERVIKNWDNVKLEWDKLKTSAHNST